MSFMANALTNDINRCILYVGLVAEWLMRWLANPVTRVQFPSFPPN